MFKKFWFPALVAALLAVTFFRLADSALRYVPHYAYIDEGHVLRNLSSIFRGEMPFNVAYGPTVFYFYAIIGLALDPIQAALGEPTYLETVVLNVPENTFYADYSPTWMLPVARISNILATLVGLLLASLSIPKERPGLRLLCLLALLSVPLYIQGAFVVTTEPLAILFFGLLIFFATRIDSDSGPWKLLGFAAVLVFLAGVKIFYALYCVLGLLAFYRRVPANVNEATAPFRSRAGLRRLAGLVGLGLALTIASHLPYRGVSDIREMLEWNFQVYDRHSKDTLIYVFLNGQTEFYSGPLIYYSHVVLVFVGVFLTMARKQRLPELALAFLGWFQLFYFLSVPWQVYRNVLTLPTLFICLTLRNVAQARHDAVVPTRKAIDVTTLLACLWFGFLFVQTLFLSYPEFRDDERIRFVKQAPIAEECRGTTHVDMHAQIHHSVFEGIGASVDYYNPNKTADRLPAGLEGGTCVLLAGRLPPSDTGPPRYSVLSSATGRQPPKFQLFIAPWTAIELHLLKINDVD